jgi:hypothetical protein
MTPPAVFTGTARDGRFNCYALPIFSGGRKFMAQYKWVSQARIANTLFGKPMQVRPTDPH